MKKPTHRTARCVLRHDDEFFMVVHSNRIRRNHGKWGLPGGRVERGEDLQAAVLRELWEELYITPTSVTLIGDYRYKGHNHRIFGADYSDPIVRFDRAEILKIGWHSLANIRRMDAEGLLHAGFEYAAVRDFIALGH